MPDTKAKRLYDKPEAAEYLKMHVKTLETLMRAGKIPAYRNGSSVRFKIEDLDNYIDNLPPWEPQGVSA